MTSKTLASLAAVAALGLAAPAAQASHVPPNLGLEVTNVDAASRTVEGIVHCTTPERAGRTEKFTVTPDITFDQFRPGVMWGIAVDPTGVIRSTGEMPCDVRPTGPPPGEHGEHGPGPVPGPGPGPHGPGPGPHGPGPRPALGPGPGPGPRFDRAFINRVWKFQVELDSAEGNKLEVTIGKVLNLPKRFRGQDDELLDEAAIVVVDKKVRVYDGGKRVPASTLENHDGDIRVHGKLVAPQKWQKDEDGEPVPTLRAKKIYL